MEVGAPRFYLQCHVVVGVVIQGFGGSFEGSSEPSSFYPTSLGETSKALRRDLRRLPEVSAIWHLSRNVLIQKPCKVPLMALRRLRHPLGWQLSKHALKTLEGFGRFLEGPWKAFGSPCKHWKQGLLEGLAKLVRSLQRPLQGP